MGSLSAQGFAEQVEEGNVSLKAALSWHLQANHFPPVNAVFIPVAEKAIERANEALFDRSIWNEQIEFPKGSSRTSLSVSEIIEQLHLDAFLDDREDDGEW